MKKYDSIHDILDKHLDIKETLEAEQLIDQMSFSKGKGFFTMGILYDILDWKSPRNKNYWNDNDNDYVKEVSTKFFLLTDDEERIDCLQELHGVRVSVASAILALIYPENYGVIDFHVWQLLHHYGLVSEKADGNNLSVINWLQFLEIIRQLAQEYKVKARDIERTLFDFHRD